MHKTILLVVLLCFNASCHVANVHSDMKSLPSVEIRDIYELLGQIKTATSQNDLAAIKRHINFPLFVMGSLDQDQQTQINERSFEDRFKIFLTEPSGKLAEPGSTRQTEEIKIITQRESILNGKPLVYGNYARLGDIEFSRVGGLWYISAIYSDLEN